MTASRSKAEERYAEIQKRERGIRQELDNATKLRLERLPSSGSCAWPKKPKMRQRNRLLRISEPRVKTPAPPSHRGGSLKASPSDHTLSAEERAALCNEVKAIAAELQRDWHIEAFADWRAHNSRT
jgi:hypothetical protein